MYPRLTTWPFTIPTYGVLVATAFLVGLWITSRQAKRAGLDAARVTDLAVWSLIAGMVGARLMLLAVDWRDYLANPREMISLLRSGGVFYGGLILGLPTALWLRRRYHLPLLPTVDVLAPGLAIGQAIGRLGCLAAGCCFGRHTTVSWAVIFRDVYAQRNVGTPLDTPLHPTQIYESLATLVLFLALVWLAPRKRFQGQVAWLYLCGYAVLRFVIEYFRGDLRGSVFGGLLSTSQLISIVVFIVAMAILPYLIRTQRRGREQSPAAAPPG